MKQPLNEVLSAAERKIFRLPSRVFFEIHKVFLQTTRFDRQKNFLAHPSDASVQCPLKAIKRKNYK